MRHYVKCTKLWQYGTSKLQVQDPGTPEDRTAKALLWHDGATTADLGRTATMLAIGYKAHGILSHRTTNNPVNVTKLFDEIRMQIGETSDGGTAA